MSSQTKYVVTLTKTFEYLGCVIDYNNTMQDIVHKVGEDFIESVNEENFNDKFDISVSSVLPFKFRKKQSPADLVIADRPVPRSTIGYYAREFAVADVQDKFGKLDSKTNPDIYVINKVPIYKQDRLGMSHIIGYDEEVFLREDVENYWEERTNRYLGIIRLKG